MCHITRRARRTRPVAKRFDSSVNTKPTYLSREGETGLRQELDNLVNVRRSEVAARIHDAKQHGDLSENAEYEEAKNEQAFVEGRIQTLEGMLKTAVIIENSGSDHAALGSTVTVESVDGAETFSIVGSAEARPADGKISNESPVGRALLGRKAGEKIKVRLPNGTDFAYTIKKIS
jgi:transcription elongation factor GreA